MQRSPVISRNGIMYVVTEKQIAGYDLTQAGKEYTAKEYKAFSLSETQKLSLYTGLTQGHDGSLFLALAENRQNYVYGFTPHLQPFLKVGPFGTGPKEKISSITVSPDGRKIFAQTPTGAVVIDIVNPSASRTLTLAKGNDQPWEYYYVPVAGPKNDVVKNDIVIFADFTSTADKGNIWGVSEAQGIWSAPGTLLPQPVLGSNGRIYYIQGGVLYGHKFNEVGVADIFSGAQATAEIANGVVTKVNIKDGGRNYQKAPKVTFTGGDGSGAQATAEITNGVVTKIDIVKSGQDYKNPPNVRFTGELNTSSNLVMDGADNMYFWDDGYLYGYSPEAKPLFEKINFTNQGFERKRAADPEAVSDNDKDKAVRNDKSSGPEQFIRLMIGPDGTLWANNKHDNALYTFKPRYASTDLTPQVVSAIALMAGGTGYTSAPAVQFVGGGGSGAQATAMMLKTQTIYRTEGKLTMSGFTVKNGQQIVLQAGGSMAFAKEFKVEKGASVLCRTGL